MTSQLTSSQLNTIEDSSPRPAFNTEKFDESLGKFADVWSGTFHLTTYWDKLNNCRSFRLTWGCDTNRHVVYYHSYDFVESADISYELTSQNLQWIKTSNEYASIRDVVFGIELSISQIPDTFIQLAMS